MREAIAKGASDAVGSWKAVAIGGLIFLVTVAIARWWFRSKEVADDAIVWAISGLIGTGVILLPLVAWNAFSLPAKRERELQEKINALQPDVDSLTAIQWTILRACNLEVEEHWLTVHSETGNAQIDENDIRDEQHASHWYSYIKSQLEDLAWNGLLRIIHDGGPRGGASFVLTPATHALLIGAN